MNTNWKSIGPNAMYLSYVMDNFTTQHDERCTKVVDAQQ